MTDRSHSAASLAACLFATCLLGQLPAVTASADDYVPAIQPASEEGQQAIAGFQVPDGMTVTLFAAEPQLANPVAFGIDEQGRIYVCETFRQQKGVEDNRGHMNWLEDDLALTSVAERVEMFRKFLGESVVDYTREQDRIRLLTDTDGDGKADRDTVFAAGFNAIEDGTGAGVLAIDGDVYYTCIPKLWKLRDDDGDGIAEVEQVLHDGYGVRVAFRGHDMHGLALGPDGRIYFSIGDRGYNVLTSEGRQFVRPDTGAVFRCERDGSQLEVFAYGLRNPQELAFDDFGNLFTGDNNSDSGDKARWVNVVEGGDTGWRMYYQYLPDRGPWNRERIWYPYRADDETSRVQPANTLPPIAHLGDGPSGLTHYPGVGLPERYAGHFFMADFRGSAGNSGIRSFAVQPKGATFELIDSDWFLKSILATDVDFGYDGKMYVSDWVDGWNGPGKGRIYTFEMPEAAQASGVTALFKEGFKQRSSDELARLLQHADYRVRQRAQLALVDQQASDTLQQIALSDAATRPRLHAIWGLGMLQRRGVKTNQALTLISLLNDSDPEVRTQAAAMLGDARIIAGGPALIDLLGKGTPREQAVAAIALGKLKTDSAIPALVTLLERNADADPVVRHAAVMGLIGCATTEQLVALSSNPSAAVRVGLVLALRRQNSPEIARFLNDGEDRIVEEAARAIHDEPIVEALPQLAKLARRSGMSDLLQRRVMNANFRLGGAEQALAVAEMAASSQLPEHLRLEAIQELMDWGNPPRLDRVTNQFRPIPTRSADEAREAVRRSLGSMLSGSDKLREKAIGLAGKYGIQDVGPELAKMFSNSDLPAPVRVEALAALGVLKSGELAGLVEAALKDNQPGVRSEGRRQLASLAPDRAVQEFTAVLKAGSPAEQQAAINVLSTLKSEAADAVLLQQVQALQRGEVAPEVALDLLLAAQERGTPALKDALARFDASRDAANPLDQFRECLAGGDAERGRDVFFGNAAASCRRCHKVNGNGGEVGPDLSGVSKDKPRDYLLESLVVPNAKIAKGFETTVFALEDGRVVAGIVRSEDDNSYRVVTPTGEVLTIQKSSVEESVKGKSGMPEDLVKQLTKRQIRDLVEYLSTLKTPIAAEGH